MFWRERWTVIEHPGYLGSRRTKRMQEWDELYGKQNWRLSRWQTAQGKMLRFPGVFKIYVDGYKKYFKEHPDEAEFIAKNFSYGYDQDFITKRQALNPYALYSKPGIANQFHHVAFNKAIIAVTRHGFEGSVPVQVREGRPGTPEIEQPNGYKWSPGRIRCVHPEIIPQVLLAGSQWWRDGTVEDFYQRAKVLQVRRRRR